MAERVADQRKLKMRATQKPLKASKLVRETFFNRLGRSAQLTAYDASGAVVFVKHGTEANRMAGILHHRDGVRIVERRVKA